MDDTIRYLNTDLDLKSTEDLTALAEAFETQGVGPLHVGSGEDGLWHATFETDEQHEKPEPNIASMIAVVESLPEQLLAVWSSCTCREFNIGYDCGSNPWAFNQVLSSQLLGRMAAAGASRRITLYPPEREKKTEQADADEQPPSGRR